jgi:hypothetical protein
MNPDSYVRSQAQKVVGAIVCLAGQVAIWNPRRADD